MTKPFDQMTKQERRRVCRALLEVTAQVLTSPPNDPRRKGKSRERTR